MLGVEPVEYSHLPGYQSRIYKRPTYNPVNRPHTETAKSDNMPVDFQSYLLAASPPGFDIHYAIRDFSRKQDRKSADDIFPVCVAADRLLIKRPATWDCASPIRDDKLSTITKWNSTDALITTKESAEEPKKTEAPVPNKRGMGKKSVSFADEIGGQLVHVRLLHEKSDCPPRLRPELISALTNGSNAEVTDSPPLKLNFAQPASDYAAFRQKLEANYVSLENVILKDYSLIGTIKVKNIAFEKQVTVRCSTDSWETFEDIPTTYVPTSTNTSLPYDTFSFELAVSPKLDLNKTIEFAVMYEANNQQFWDNNGGSNYEVVPADWKDSPDEDHNTTTGVVFGLGQSDAWSTFCGWNKMSNSVPYY